VLLGEGRQTVAEHVRDDDEVFFGRARAPRRSPLIVVCWPNTSGIDETLFLAEFSVPKVCMQFEPRSVAPRCSLRREVVDFIIETHDDASLLILVKTRPTPGEGRP